ncbi:MAG: Hsp20/alpha crystallin family protein [Betaproteobacteria bacterium]|nr:MAG: Hsp20/alpha crystallin family protein [Betaproteobacteria bacterium]
MTLVRYNPALRNFSSRSFNNILDRFFHDTFETNGNGFVPAVDISETDKTFELELAVPGFKKDDFTIDFNNDQLTISGERKFEKEQEELNYLTRETRYGTFSRTFHLPENVNDTKIQAAYNDGILKITLPKDEKKELKRTIKIN